MNSPDITLIKNVSEEVYGKVTMTPRSALSDEMLQLVNNGEKGYFSNAYIKITKEDLNDCLKKLAF